MLIDNRTGTLHSKGVWLGQEEVREMTIFSDRNRKTISFLIMSHGQGGSSKTMWPFSLLKTIQEILSSILLEKWLLIGSLPDYMKQEKVKYWLPAM